MSEVNHQDINLAATYVSQNHSRCCCRKEYTQGICAKCKPTVQICCLKGVHSACGFELMFARAESSGPGTSVNAEWEPGDECDFLGPTNLCGDLYAIWGEGAKCGPWMWLRWQVKANCTDVEIQLRHGAFTGPWITVGRDWYLSPLEIEDPMSRYYYGIDPERYHLETITFTGCDTEDVLKACGPSDIYVRAWVEWSPTGSGTGWEPYNGYAKGLGSCCCGKGINCASDGGASDPSRGYVTWGFSIWECKIVLTAAAGSVPSVSLRIDGDCVTDGLPATIYVPGLEDTLRWQIEATDACEHDDPEDPDPPPPDPPPPPPDPPPEPCVSGCWPPCVMCPTRKTLYAVIDGAPVCCLDGAYELTWVPTGGEEFPLAGYYELPSPVGGPIDDCGVIDFLRVYCVDLNTIQVQLVYRRAEGEEISNLGSPLTLDVTCDGEGNMESDVFNIPGRSGDRESLCGFGDGVGGNLRIVTA